MCNISALQTAKMWVLQRKEFQAIMMKTGRRQQELYLSYLHR